MRVKALQDQCVAKEDVVTQVRKHSTNLMDQYEQYKQALRTQNLELKEIKEKLEGAGRQKEKLEEELTTLCKQVEKVGTNAVQEFKASQSFIDSYAEYYGTRFDDCLKQVASSFPQLDLFGITMDDPMPTTPAGDTIVDEGDDSTELDLPLKDDGVVLAMPAANPPVSNSNPSIELLDVENPLTQNKGDEISNDAPATQSLFL